MTTLAIAAPKQQSYSLRYDRAAAYISLAGGLFWLVLVGALFLNPINAPGIARGIRQLATATSALHMVIGLVLLAEIDLFIGWALLQAKRGGRFLALLRISSGFGLCLAYYAATEDFVLAIAVAIILHGGMAVLLTRNAGLMLAYPGIAWLGIFFIVPLFSVVAYSFGQGTSLGTVDLSAPSFENYQRIVSPVGVSGYIYITIIARTLWVAFLNTAICVALAYPFAFWMAAQPERWRNLILVLVMIPFWTNLLIRTYAWLIILRRDGLVNDLLVDTLKIIDRPLEMTNTMGALLLGLVYGYLPYMILPLYQTVERLDKRYLEAAGDLYATPSRTFWRVTWPLTLPGVIAGSILVFVPSVGSYVITNVLGGGRVFLIGNLLEQQFIGSSGNKAFGAAFGVVLTVFMLGATMIYFRLGRKDV
jgi:spermidine/putrescine transport system permease protein